MKSKKWLYFALLLIIIGVLTRIVLTLFVEPWIDKKLETTLTDKNPNYEIQISKVHISLFSRGLELNEIVLSSKSEVSKSLYISGTIASVKLYGISIIKAVLKKDIFIKSVTVSESRLSIITAPTEENRPSIILPVNIKIDRLIMDKTNLVVRNKLNSLSHSLTEVMIKVDSINFYKQDSLSIERFKNLEFAADDLSSVSADSMVTYNVKDIAYSSVSNSVSADTFSIVPNYSDYDYASRFKFQKDRIEVVLSSISVPGFNITEYLSSGSLICPYIEAGNLDLKIFRDKRKEFNHVNKPEFMDMIYGIKGIIRLDTISILNGKITYKDHAEKANEPGSLTFNKVKARIYNITNDSFFVDKKAFLELRCSALLMGKGNMEVLLKSNLFDIQNIFTVTGTLSGMDISDMNPYLEKSALIYVTSGRLDKMDFNFTANSTEANGTMTMLYNGLDIAVKNKNTDDTTAFKERLISLIVNIKVINANPLPGKETRVGIIKYERDPEKFLFAYCAKAILSGIKSSLLKNKKDK